MSNFGIRKGTRRFKPQATKERPAPPKDVEQRKESQEQGVRIEQDSVQQSRKRSVPDESSSSTPSRTVPATTQVPLSLVEQTLDEYHRRKRRRPLGLPKEELKRLAQKEAEEEEAKQREKELNPHTPQVKLVDGEIVLDTSSLFIDTQADHTDREVVEEGEHIKMKRGPINTPRMWTQQETELFFELLAEHGADFEAISKRIPGRSRNQVQRKYKAEYSMHPSRIDNLLINKHRFQQ